MKESWLNEQERAQDIILGSLGFGEDVKLLSFEETSEGFKGIAIFPDGIEIAIENDGELTHLERWALGVLASARSKTKR